MSSIIRSFARARARNNMKKRGFRFSRRQLKNGSAPDVFAKNWRKYL